MPITDAWLKAANGKLRESLIEKADRDGVSARVTPKGKITFQLRYRINSKQNRVDLGVYPLISLKAARDLADKYRADLSAGHDPRIVKKLATEKNSQAVTFEDLFRKWHDSYCIENKKNAQEIMRSFEIHMFPKLGILPTDKISADKWLTLLEGIKGSSSSVAERLLINTKQMLSWAKRRNLIERNELAEITAKRDLSIIKKRNFRSLNDDEIKMFFFAVEGSRIAYKNKLFMILCLIYGCRNGELRIAKKKHFDFKAMVWTIPPENHKTGQSSGQPLLRPIIKETKLIIEQCFHLSNSDYLFNNVGTNEPISQGAPLSLPYNIMQWLRKNKDYEMAHWSIHDLRKTARTNFSTITQPHIAEIMLGHALPGEWRTYDRHDYLKEQALCLEEWCQRLKLLKNPVLAGLNVF
jgi:integrase